MTVTIKTPEDIEKMRVAGRLAAEVLEMIGEHVKPGVTTEELDRLCHDYIVNVQQATPAPLNYKGFPKSICTSINHVVCHGIPNDKPLKDGDILNIDITVIKDGYHGDTSKMFMVGKVPEWAERLCQVTQECLYKGIELVRPGARLGDIGEVIQKHAEKNGFSVVREYCGHGIGNDRHQGPQALGAMGAHHPGHRRWLRDLHAAQRRHHRPHFSLRHPAAALMGGRSHAPG